MSVRDGVGRRFEVDTGELLATLPDTVVQLDRDLRLVEVNHKGSPVFACPPSAGDTLGDVFDAEAAAMITRLVARSRNSGTSEGEHGTGSRVFKVIARSLVSAPVTVLVFQDITARRNAVRALAESLGDKGGVMKSVGHRLAGPLSAVLGYAGLLSGPDDELDDTGRRAIVEHMTDQAWMLAGMIEDMTTLAHSEAGDLRVVKVPVNLLANAAQVIESMGWRGSQVSISGDRQVVGVGDPARVRQIVRILLTNALTHGAEPVSVDVTNLNGRAILDVRDHGRGIASDVKNQIFVMLPNVTAGDGSPMRGIGLWVANELAGLMGGTLDHATELGPTTFRLSIPHLDA